MWARRVWRFIDVKQKINLPLFYPLDPIDERRSLFDVLVTALLEEGTLTAYDDLDGSGDQFKKPMTQQGVKDQLESRESVQTIDPDNGESLEIVVTNKITSGDVVGYKIKEDHIFDKQRGVMDVRIIGIAPVVVSRGEDGEVRGQRTLFWLYYPECRYIFASARAFNRHNDAEQRTFDEIFTKRFFHGQVVKVSNVYDRGINEVQTGVDALLSSQEWDRWLVEYEQDLWHY